MARLHRWHRMPYSARIQHVYEHLLELGNAECRTRNAQVRFVDIRNPGNTSQRHRAAELSLEDIQHSSNAVGTVVREAPKNWTPDPDMIRSQGQGSENIGTPSNSTVQNDRYAALYGVCNAWQHFDRRRCGVQLPAAMIGDDDCVGTM